MLHPSVAVAVPNAAVISLAAGLHPNGIVVNVLVNVGGVTSSVHVTVLAAVDVLLHPSFAVKVLFIERLHPLLTTEPSEEVIVTGPQASVAVAVPNEPEGSAGLQPRSTSA